MWKWHGSIVFEMQEEKLKFGCHQEVVTHGLCHIQGTEKCSARIAIKAFAIRSTHITNDSSDGACIEQMVSRPGERCWWCRLRTHFIWHDGKCVQVRIEVHITFSNTRKR